MKNNSDDLGGGRSRRGLKRVASKNLIKTYLDKSGSKPPILTNIFDISLGGAKILIHSKLNTGVSLDIELNLSETNTVLPIKCSIRHISPWKANRGSYFVGVEFIDLTPQDKKLLKLHLKKIS